MPSVKTDDTMIQANNLSELFARRVHASPNKVACRYFDPDLRIWQTISWSDLAQRVGQWQSMLQQFGLQAGDHVAIKLENGPDWVVFDQAAQGLGLVIVPLYVKDRSENVVYICEHADVKLLLLSDARAWSELADVHTKLKHRHILLASGTESPVGTQLVQTCLPNSDVMFQVAESLPNSLASIVYTSGTTGRPKGVMLSHRNILSNAANGLQSVTITSQDVFLSFLPLSHMLERSIGYYLCMMAGAEIAYVRSIGHLAEDIQHIQPTVMISVPRIFERIYHQIQTQLASQSWFVNYVFQCAVRVGWQRFEYQQHRLGWRPSLWLWPIFERLVANKIKYKMGGRLRVIIAGGAAMPKSVAQTFISLGLPILQGYGLTESSPVIAVNTLKRNIPSSIGLPLANEQVKVGAQDELMTKGEHVMLGYWKNKQATEATIDSDGWLHTGDQARIDDEGFIYITGRLKEIIVLSNGEKVPPSDIESAIITDPWFEQVLLVGEGRSFLSVLVVLNQKMWPTIAAESNVACEVSNMCLPVVEKVLLQHIATQVRHFPGYAKIRRATVCPEAWCVDNGLLTPTLKVRRAKVLQCNHDAVERMYEGH